MGFLDVVWAGDALPDSAPDKPTGRRACSTRGHPAVLASSTMHVSNVSVQQVPKGLSLPDNPESMVVDVQAS